MVGARDFLIAYNVNLETHDVDTAQKIALKIRESSGGFPHVKAMGVMAHGRAQIAMNLTNYAETPLARLYAEILSEASRLGTSVHSSEVIGFVPRRAYEIAPGFFRSAENFDESRILETRIDTIKASAGKH